MTSANCGSISTEEKHVQLNGVAAAAKAGSGVPHSWLTGENTGGAPHHRKLYSLKHLLLR